MALTQADIDAAIPHPPKLNKHGKMVERPKLYPDRDGLSLQASRAADGGVNRSWVYIYRLKGKTREMGLGAYSEMPLIAARRAAAKLTRDRKTGVNVDPLGTRQADTAKAQGAREQARKDKASRKTFKECRIAFVAAKRHEWRHTLHGSRSYNRHENSLTSMLERFAGPFLDPMWVGDITTDDVLKVLNQPYRTKYAQSDKGGQLWTTYVQAGYLQNRIERVLDWAKEYRTPPGKSYPPPNPARWVGHLEFMLASKSKLRQDRSDRHRLSMPPKDLPGFWPDLVAKDTAAARQLQFAILTVGRVDMVRLMTWGEIDKTTTPWVWTCPKIRLKRFTKDLRIPLSEPAMALLRRMDEVEAFRPAQNHRKLNSEQVEAIREDIMRGDLRSTTCEKHSISTSVYSWIRRGVPDEKLPRGPGRVRPGVKSHATPEQETRWRKGIYQPYDPGQKPSGEHLPTDPVFPAVLNRQADKPRNPFLADNAMLIVLKYLGVLVVDPIDKVKKTPHPHGFRGSFKTWASESKKNYPKDIVEVAMAHSQGTLDEAYQHSDLFDKRVELMRDWGRFVTTRKVIELESEKRRRAKGGR
jgi:hypothetical protein